MRMKQLFIGVLVAFLSGSGIARAQYIETVELNDGSILEGYICEQIPGKSISFNAKRSTLLVPANQVSSMTYVKHSIDTLPEEWKAWVDENPQKDQTLELCQIVLSKESSEPHLVKILERGSVIKFVDLTPQCFSVPWNDIRVLRRSPRPELTLNGVVDVVRLKEGDREISGEIIEQVLGKQLRLMKEDGEVEVVDVAEIASIRKEPLNKAESLFQQSPLLDTVTLKTGEGKIGIIASQNFVSSEGNSSYLVLTTKSEGDLQIRHADVANYGRLINPEYVADEDILLDDQTFLLNREPVQLTDFEQDEKCFVYATDTTNLVRLNQADFERIVLELKQTSVSGDFAYISAVKTEPSRREPEKIGFTYEQFAMFSARPIQQSVTVNGTQRLEFAVGTEPYFVLYVPKIKKGILCVLE